MIMRIYLFYRSVRFIASNKHSRQSVVYLLGGMHCHLEAGVTDADRSSVRAAHRLAHHNRTHSARRSHSHHLFYREVRIRRRSSTPFYQCRDRTNVEEHDGYASALFAILFDLYAECHRVRDHHLKEYFLHNELCGAVGRGLVSSS